MKLKYLSMMVLLIGLILLPAPALQAQEAPPPLPALCYGQLMVNGQPAPVGTTVTAKVDGEERGELVSTEVGMYGGPGLQSKLTVAGDDLQGKMVRFYVSGTINGTAYSDVFAGEELFWGSGEVRQINLGVADVANAPTADPPAEPDPEPQPEEADDPEPAEDEEETEPVEGEEESEEEPEPDEEEAVEDETEEEVETAAISTGWIIAAAVIVAAALLVLLISRRIGKGSARVKSENEE